MKCFRFVFMTGVDKCLADVFDSETTAPSFTDFVSTTFCPEALSITLFSINCGSMPDLLVHIVYYCSSSWFQMKVEFVTGVSTAKCAKKKFGAGVLVHATVFTCVKAEETRGSEL